MSGDNRMLIRRRVDLRRAAVSSRTSSFIARVARSRAPAATSSIASHARACTTTNAGPCRPGQLATRRARESARRSAARPETGAIPCRHPRLPTTAPEGRTTSRVCRHWTEAENSTWSTDWSTRTSYVRGAARSRPTDPPERCGMLPRRRHQHRRRRSPAPTARAGTPGRRCLQRPARTTDRADRRTASRAATAAAVARPAGRRARQSRSESQSALDPTTKPRSHEAAMTRWDDERTSPNLTQPANRNQPDETRRNQAQPDETRRPVHPVDPNPPAPRSLSGSADTVSHVTRVTGATTSCAMRMPRSIVTGAAPRLMSATFTSPR